MMLIFIFCLMLSILLMYINSLLSKKSFKEREKLTPFECGFDPNSSARMPFSMRFFLIAIMFLIFDVEITLILPMPYINFLNNPYNLIILSTTFILILLLGIMYEWKNGALEWF